MNANTSGYMEIVRTKWTRRFPCVLRRDSLTLCADYLLSPLSHTKKTQQHNPKTKQQILSAPESPSHPGKNTTTFDQQPKLLSPKCQNIWRRSPDNLGSTVASIA